MQKKQYLSEKKIVQRGSPKKKKIPAQAVSEKKIRASWKFPTLPPPHHFSNGPSLKSLSTGFTIPFLN